MIWIIAGATPLLIALWLFIMMIAHMNHVDKHARWRKEDRCTCGDPDISYWKYTRKITLVWLCVVAVLAAIAGCCVMIGHGMDQVWPSDN
ncbi:hypothetical protein PP304_gp107 [Gordonia phage Phendrix]|uniref:Transmembrane protein n=2 Tax=Godonkavirus TaxID=2733178 RepID=A0A4D6E232_9CAUD|nr:hypothetical protein HOV33_gp111 [Gordonia phage GodonK]YP_010649151.1 hypothetical protein PP304_gp107 [Gordonia phage Phendrix]QBZ72730.1 hypothetical protein SEA_GODONK_111 [Gordonia phage GodonK]QDK02655.1 hypothetical protein SEA_PHENDRIX_107 [Gordonia phage Phendrix]